MSDYVPAKDPDSVEPYHFVWCSKDGTNDGTASDTGELQSATISSATVTVDSGLTKDSDNTNAVTIAGVSYDINTVVTVWLSGGTANTDYNVLCRITTSDSRTLDKTMIVPVREQ
jgi:hypothetical protein